jgi:hypothetical protein
MDLNFLSPAYLWALPFVFAPLLIHLLSRRTPRKDRFSDLRFIRLAVEKVKNRVRLRKYLLMAVRILALLALILFFGRPVYHAGALLGRKEAATNYPVVLLMDVSYSMGYQESGTTRMEKSRQRARDVLRLLPGTARIGVIAYSDRVEAATPNLTGDRAALAAFIDAVKLSNRTTDSKVILPLIGRLREQYAAGDLLLVLLSDNAQHGYRTVPKGSLEKNIKVITFPAEGGDNLWIDAGEVRFEEEKSAWHIEALMRGRTPGGETSWPVALFEKDRRALDDLVRPPADGEGLRRRFECPADETAPFSGRLELADDRLACDNRYYLAGARPAAFKLWVIDGDPRFGGTAAESYYLHTALPSAEVVAEGDAKDLRLVPPGVVVLANVREDVPAVASFVNAGGGAIVFPGDHSLDAFNPSYLCAMPGVKFEQPQSVSWTAGQKALPADFPAQEFEWQKLVVEKGVVLSPREDATVLARLSSGWPYLVTGNYGRGRVAAFASTADHEWNNMVSRPLYAPFMKNLVRYLAQLPDAELQRSLVVGDTFVHPAVEEAAILTPAGRRISLPGGQAIVFNGTDEPGIYALLSRGEETAQFAVNLDRRTAESDLASASTAEIKRYFKGADVLFLPAANWEKRLSAAVAGREFSRPLIALVLLLLLAETLLAHPARRREKAA